MKKEIGGEDFLHKQLLSHSQVYKKFKGHIHTRERIVPRKRS